jgi:hypothetical protein
MQAGQPAYRRRIKLLYYYYRCRLTRQGDCTVYKKLYICRLTGQMVSTGAGWSYGRQYRCRLVIWKTIQMRAGHLEDNTDAGWSFGRQYRCVMFI